MNVKNRIYEALLESRDGEVTLEEFLAIPCAYRHYLRIQGAETNSKHDLKGHEVLMREVTRAQLALVRRYLADCYADRFVPLSSLNAMGAATFDLVGLLDGVPVDVAILPTSRYNPMKPPRAAILSAITKAAYLWKAKTPGTVMDRALLITMDRNNQEWAFFELEGEFSKITKPIYQDLAYVGRGEAMKHPTGTASDKTCSRCPFEAVCTATRTGADPHPYSTDGILVKPALSKRAEVDGHLWSLNGRPNRRRKGVIHPSEFSITPCDRRIAYGILAEDEKESISPKLRRIFDVGHCFHDVVQAALDWAFPGFREEVRVEHDDTKIVGHCDGVFPEPLQTKGAEIKSINLKGFQGLKKAKPDHQKQATLYGAILELLGIEYIYACKETGELAVFSVPVDRKLWHRQATRAANILRTIEAGDMPPRIDKEYLCKNCKYSWKCMPKLSQTTRSPKKRAFR
jgi:CRISPR/Cas system-associated exonuclease Cas4 (RecB family)